MNNIVFFFLYPYFYVRNMFEPITLDVLHKYEFQKFQVLLPFYLLKLWLSQNFKINGAHLMFKNDIWKKRTIYIGVLSALNMQKDSWNIINLCEILTIEYLQVMEFIPKEKMEIQIIMLAWWFLKDTRVQFLNIVYTPLLYVLLCSHPHGSFLLVYNAFFT
jgi:hypothetical protein